MAQQIPPGLPSHPTNHLPAIIATVIVTAVLVGLSVYWFVKPVAVPAPSESPTAPSSSTPSQTGYEQFIQMAQTAECAGGRNELHLIDETFVVWLHQGACADAGYGYTLYGKHPSDVLCQLGDSIAGPQESCTQPQYKALFDEIKKHVADPVFSLPGHTAVLLFQGSPPTPTPTKKSGIDGMVIGEYCNGAPPPSPLPSGYQSCGEEPLASLLLNIKNNATGITKQATTDSAGIFQIELSPGEYTVSQERTYFMGGPFTVQVKSGIFTGVTLKFQELRP